MKSRQSLRNSVRSGLLKISFLISLLSGCTLSTTPTYLKEGVGQAIQDICKNEYKLDIKAKVVGESLWIYLPSENIFEKSDKPEKSVERFSVAKNDVGLTNGLLKLEYIIKPVPEKEISQETPYVISKDFIKKYYNVRNAILRVLFSMERSEKKEQKFVCIVSADTKNGFVIKEITYYLDLKKVSYNYISTGEYQHRTIQDMYADPQVIGDKEGARFVINDIKMGDFICWQILQRIKLKFQKPEVGKNVDIDKEILKIVIYTLKTYGFQDFSDSELNNLVTNNRAIFNRAAILARPIE